MANLSRTFGNRSRRTGEAIWIMLGVLLLGCALALPLGASDDTALALILLGTAVIAYLIFPSRWQLWSLVAIAVYFQPLEALQLPISQSNVHLLDLFVRWALQMHTWRLTRRSGYLLAAILAILLIPALVGMLKGNIVVTVLRDMRVPFYYITLSLLVVSSVRTRADLIATLRGIALLVLPALAYYFVSWALGIPTSEGASTVILSSGRYLRYGLVTSWEYIMLSWLLGLAFFLTGDVPPQWRPWLALYTLLSTVALMALLVRGIYLGMLGLWPLGANVYSPLWTPVLRPPARPPIARRAWRRLVSSATRPAARPTRSSAQATGTVGPMPTHAIANCRPSSATAPTVGSSTGLDSCRAS